MGQRGVERGGYKIEEVVEVSPVAGVEDTHGSDKTELASVEVVPADGVLVKDKLDRETALTDRERRYWRAD